MTGTAVPFLYALARATEWTNNLYFIIYYYAFCKKTYLQNVTVVTTVFFARTLSSDLFLQCSKFYKIFI